MIVRRLACHAAPSDTAVFYEELRVALATARTVLSLAQQVSVSLTSAWKAAAWSPAAREDWSKTATRYSSPSREPVEIA